MSKINEKKLLEIPEVIDEINRHLWIESQKVGHDIGFEQASRQWMENYAKDWMNYFMPEKKEVPVKEASDSKESMAKKEITRRPRRRSAKTYS